MGKYELTKTDYEILENLLDVSKQIRFQYTSLMSLEIDNKKNTNEYQLLLQRLYELLSFEKRCYDSISNNPDKVDAFIKYFNTEDNLNDFFEEIHIMIDGKDCDLIKYRIIIRTLAIKTNINQKKLYDFGNEVKEEIKELDINLPEEINNSYFDLANLIELAKMLKQDFLNTLLSLANIDFQIKIKYLIA